MGVRAGSRALGDAVTMGFIGVSRRIRHLRSKRPEVRAAAVSKLAALRNPRAVLPLCAMLDDEERALRVAAAQALGVIGHPSAIGPLISTLVDEKYWDVRYEVVEALRAIGDPQAINELLLILESDRHGVDVQQFTAWALKEFGWDRLSPAQQARVLIMRDEWSALPQLGSEAIEPLMEAVRTGTPRVQRDAADALARIGDARSVAALEAWVRIGAGELARIAAHALEKHAWTRLAPESLARISIVLDKWSGVAAMGEAALGPIDEAMRTGDRPLRVQAVSVLGQIGGSDAVARLITAMQDCDVAVRREAAKALSGASSPESADALAGALGDHDLAIRRAAAAGLERLGWRPPDAGARARLAIARQDAVALRQLGGVAVEALLEDLEVAALRGPAVEALAAIGAPATAALVEVLRGRDAARRQGALAALGAIRDRSAVPAVEALLADGDVAVRRAAADTLAQLGWRPGDAQGEVAVAVACEYWEKVIEAGPAAVDPLLKRLRQEPQADDALQAIETILQSAAIHDIPVFHLQALAAVGQVPQRPRMGGRPLMNDPGLKSAVARRRVAQLARSELQRRRLPA